MVLVNFSLICFHIVLCGFLDVSIFLFDCVLIWALRTHMAYLSTAIACFIFAALRKSSFVVSLVVLFEVFSSSSFLGLLDHFCLFKFPCYQICDCSEYLLHSCMSCGTFCSATRTATQPRSIENHITLGYVAIADQHVGHPPVKYPVFHILFQSSIRFILIL
jgi:hypothetical protein